MALISSSIPNFVNGVSQQPFTLRLASQLEMQENGLSTVAQGLMKRPPIKHLKKLIGTAMDGAFVHIINRDSTERYVVVVSNGSLRVFDLNGNEKTVTFPNGTGYLASTDPISQFSAVTVADYTFLVNKTVPVGLSLSTAPLRPNEAIVSVIQGNYGRTYSVILNGSTVASFATPDGSTASQSPQIANDNIAAQLQSQIAAAGWSVTRANSTLYISSVADFTISCTDGFNNNAMKAIKGSVQKFSDLPGNCNNANGFIVKVTGDPGAQEDDYFVQYQVAGGQGVWREVVGPGALLGFTPQTMPFILVRNADGTFTFKQGTWANRTVGDRNSCPDPSFVGKTITDVFFYRNRLGFLSDEAVLFSESGDYWNFYRTTVTTLLDSDPIDVSATSTKVSLLKHAIGFNKQLLIFSDQQQFIIDNNDLLTPKTVGLKPVTDFVCSDKVRPVSVGKNIYFVSEKQGWSSVREYFTDTNNVGNDSTDATGHCPQYIPTGTFRLAASASENMVCVLTAGERNAIYVYKFFWSDTEKLQSSWSKWPLPATDKVLAMEFLNSELVLVISRPDGVYLEKLTATPGEALANEPYTVHLDRRVTIPAASLTYADGKTTIPMGWAPTDGDYMAVVPLGQPKKAGISLDITPGVGNTGTIPGNFTGCDLIVGRKYTFRFQLSTITVKTAASTGGTKSDTEGRLQLRKVGINFSETGFFQAKVTPRYRDTYTYTFTGKTLGTPSSTIGTVALETGHMTFPVMTRNTDATIIIENDSPLPSSFLSADWEGYYVKRSQAV